MIKLIEQIILCGFVILTPMDPKENGYQRPPLWYLMKVWALASRESGGTLEWMRSVLKENNLDASLSKGVWWEDHLGLEN